MLKPVQWGAVGAEVANVVVSGADGLRYPTSQEEFVAMAVGAVEVTVKHRLPEWFVPGMMRVLPEDSLVALVVSGVSLEKEEFASMAPIVAWIKSFAFISSRLGDDHMVAFAERMMPRVPEGPTLLLDFNHQDITARGMSALLAKLAELRYPIESLNLSGNRIESMEPLVQYLRHPNAGRYVLGYDSWWGSVLKRVDVRENPCTDWRALARAVDWANINTFNGHVIVYAEPDVTYGVLKFWYIGKRLFSTWDVPSELSAVLAFLEAGHERARRRGRNAAGAFLVGDGHHDLVRLIVSFLLRPPMGPHIKG